MRIILLLLILSFSFTYNHSFSQHTDKIWCFGDSAGIDFNQNPPSPIYSSINSRGTCASICDSNGNLLFYSGSSPDALNAPTVRGGKINSFNHQMMQKGDTIITNAWYKEQIIVPFPINDSLYYLFCAGVTPVSGFYYSVINSKENNGLGGVVQKNVELLDSNFMAADGLAAIKHGNGIYWWIIVRHWDTHNNEFHFFLVTESGVYPDHIQNIGDIVQSGFFRVEPSSNGDLISCITNGGLITIFDFDRCTGMLSNEQLIEHEASNPNNAPWYWDCEFNKSANLLYISTSNSNDTDYLFQYHLNDSNPFLTRDTLYTLNPNLDGGALKLGPDNKMYWTCNYNPPGVFPYPYPDSVRNMYNENLSVINYPDSLGTACDLQPFSFYLGGKRTYYGLPNNPNYELGPLTGSICDTLTGLSDIGMQNTFTIFPNPAKQYFTVTGNDFDRLILFDQMGKEVISSGLQKVSIEGLSEGIYFYRIWSRQKQVCTGKVIVIGE